MNENKRFELVNGIITDMQDNERMYGIFELVDLLNEKQATINNQEQRIKILQQEIDDTQAILEMLVEKLKGWNDE